MIPQKTPHWTMLESFLCSNSEQTGGGGGVGGGCVMRSHIPLMYYLLLTVSDIYLVLFFYMYNYYNGGIGCSVFIFNIFLIFHYFYTENTRKADDHLKRFPCLEQMPKNNTQSGVM